MGQTTDYIAFRLEGTSPSGKTKIWQVLNYSGEVAVHLGHIRWRGSWRCYVFAPAPDTVYEWKCLREIATFAQTETDRHRSVGQYA